MQTYNVSSLPSMVTLGYDGENNWRPNSFDCSPLLADHPNGTISLWLLPNGETQAFPVALTRNGNSVVWTPLSEEMTAATGALQLVCTDGTDVGKSAVVLFRVDESIVPGADHPATVPSWATETIERAESAADRAEAAAESIDIEHIEQIISAAVEAYLIKHPVQAPVQSVNGMTGVVVLGASDVGALPDTYVAPVQSVNGRTGAVAIPIPTVPQMATAADMSDWTSGKTVDAAVLKADFQSAGQSLEFLRSEVSDLDDYKADKTEIPTAVSELTNDSGFQTAAQVQSAIAAIPDELPAVTASDNGKFLRVVNGAWAAQTVPIAEEASF